MQAPPATGPAGTAVPRPLAAVPRPLAALPKAHLHAHLDGSYPLAAVQALAARRGGGELHVPERFADVWAFFDAYGTVPALVASLDDLAELCRALVDQEARAGVLYLEPAIEPQLYAPRLGTAAEVTRCMLTAFREAGAAAGIEVGALLTVNTDADLAIADDLARLAAGLAGDGITAFGTACFIEPAGLHRYRTAASIARAAGLPLVCHAGQTGGPESVLEALDLGAARISHGFRAVESGGLVRRLADEGIVCDVCPVSNVALGVVPALDVHPARQLIAAGVPVTLNADDQLWFGADVTDQYRIARDVWGLDDRQLAALAGAGTAAAGMSDTTRARFHASLTDWLGDEPRKVDR
jgi:adenosine deaminase